MIFLKKYFLFLMLLISNSLLAQDQYEPNENIISATRITLDQSFFGSIHNSDDIDVYEFELSRSGVPEVRVTNIPDGVTVQVVLQNANGTSISVEDSGDDTNGAYVATQICAAGLYYVRIRRGGFTFSPTQELYELNVTFNTSDIYECNASFDSATEINLNTDIDANIYRSGDDDFYKFFIPSAGVINIIYRVLDSGTQRLTLYNQTEEIGTTATGQNGPEIVTLRRQVCESDTFFIQVEWTSFTGPYFNDYQLNISHEIEDIYECNNNFNDAIEITPCQNISGSINPSGEQDWFKMQIDEPGDYEAQILDVASNLDMNFLILDELGATLPIECNNSQVGFPVSCNFTIETSGLYYFQLRAGSGQFSTDVYRFTTTVECNSLMEICNNGIDDDGDDLIDCDDPDCSDQPTNDCPSCGEGTSFADVLIEYSPGCATADPTPTGATGINDWISTDQNGDTPEAVFLGEGGSIELGFTDNLLTNSGDSDPDLRIFEIGPLVEASIIALRPADTFTTNELNGNLDTDSGGYFIFGEIGGATSYLDIDAVVSGYENGELRFDAVKITDISDDDCSGMTPGADIDAICALSSIVPNDCATLTATVTTTNAICNTDTLGIIEVNASGGTAPYMYRLMDNPPQAENIYEGVPVGTYRITVIDSEDCEFEITNIAITDGCEEENELKLIVGEVSGASGDTVRIPVMLEGCNALASLQGTIDFDNLGILDILSFENATINLFGENTAYPPSFTFFDAGATGVTINDGDVLFYLTVRLTGESGEESSVELVNDFLPVQLACFDENGAPQIVMPQLIDGLVTIVDNYTVSGQIRNRQGVGINNTRVEMAIISNGNIVPSSLVSTMTDINGNYSFDNITAGFDWQISATKHNSPRNGLSAFDIFMINRYISGFSTPEITSPFQVIAGDADCSEDTDVSSPNDNITAFDFLLINRVLLGLDADFSSCESRSWHFVEQSHPVDDLNTTNLFGFEGGDILMNVNQDLTYNFTGVKIGGVLGNANPSNFGGTDNVDSRSNAVLNLNKQAIIDEEQNEVYIHLSVVEAQQLASCQMELEFDEDALEFISVEPVGLMEQGLSHQTENDIRLSWFSLSGRTVALNADDLFVRLKFRLKTNEAPAEHWLNIKTDDNYMASLAYNAAFEKQRIKLITSETTTSITQENAQAFNLKLFPNPATSIVNLSFYMTNQQAARINIFNVLGQTIYQQEQAISVGHQTVSIPTKDWKTGVYFLVLETKQGKYYENFIVK